MKRTGRIKTIGAYEAKTHLAAVLARVERGESFTITKHGRSVAVLTPVNVDAAGDVRAVVAELRALRRGRKLGNLSLRGLISEGRH